MARLARVVIPGTPHPITPRGNRRQQNGIKIEYTHRKGGTDETKNYEVKDTKELEKKHPEGFKLYQQYLGNQIAQKRTATELVGLAALVILYNCSHSAPRTGRANYLFLGWRN